MESITEEVGLYSDENYEEFSDSEEFMDNIIKLLFDNIEGIFQLVAISTVPKTFPDLFIIGDFIVSSQTSFFCESMIFSSLISCLLFSLFSGHPPGTSWFLPFQSKLHSYDQSEIPDPFLQPHKMPC